MFLPFLFLVLVAVLSMALLTYILESKIFKKPEMLLRMCTCAGTSARNAGSASLLFPCKLRPVWEGHALPGIPQNRHL